MFVQIAYTGLVDDWPGTAVIAIGRKRIISIDEKFIKQDL